MKTTSLMLAAATAAFLLPHYVHAQPRLTDITIFSTDASGNEIGYDVWDTMPTNSVPDTYNIWIKGASGFLNGPSSAQAQPNLALSPGANSFGIFAFPGFETASYGVNLFFNGSTNPSISAFAPLMTSAGPHSFSVDSSSTTLAVGPFGSDGISPSQIIPAAGTLSFTYGGEQITLSDYFWEAPQVNNINVVQPWAALPDPGGNSDNVGGLTLTVTTIPEPGTSLWLLALSFVIGSRLFPALKCQFSRADPRRQRASRTTIVTA